MVRLVALCNPGLGTVVRLNKHDVQSCCSSVDCAPEKKATMAVSQGGLTSELTGGRRCVRTKVLESARWRHLSLSGLSDMTRRGVKINTESLDSGQEGQGAHCCQKSPGRRLLRGVVRLEGGCDAKPGESLNSCLLLRAGSLKRLPCRSARDCCGGWW